MFSYILKRLLLMIPTLFGILLLTFVVIQFVPGGPVEQMVSMISLARQFEMQMRMITTAETNDRAATQVLSPR
jgi:ABC-type microcin C transport system permease subunit YejB